MKLLLVTEDLAVSIADQPVCTNLNLQIEAGQHWAILGSNGSGKTTLLHTLAGLLPPKLGKIMLTEEPLAKLSRKEIAKQIGILFQHTEATFPMTCLQMVLNGRHPQLNGWRWENTADIELAKQFLTVMGLARQQDQLVATLSGGERQRLAIATLLCQQPQLYLLDEPTNYLDMQYQIKILNYFKQLTLECKKTTIMVLHDINLAARYCTHVILLDGNGYCLAGPTSTLLQKKYLERIYQHTLHELIGPFGKMWVAA